MSLRIRLTSIAIAALVLAGGGCQSVNPAPIPTPTHHSVTDTDEDGGDSALTIGLTYIPDIQFSPLYVAQEKGYFADAGLDVTLRHHGQSESLLGALGQGEEQVVIASADEMVQAASHGIDVTSIYTMYGRYPAVLIVPEDSPITSAADVKGKTIGIPGRFGTNWFALLAFLSANGLSEDDVRIEEIGYTQQTALMSGHVDGVVGYLNNDAAQLRAAGTKVRTLELSSDGTTPPLVSVSVGVAASELKARPQVYRALAQAIDRAIVDVIDDPAGTVDIAAHYIPTLVSEEAKQRARTTLDATIAVFGTPEQRRGDREDDYVRMIDFLNVHGLLEAPVEVSDVWTPAFLPDDSR